MARTSRGLWFQLWEGGHRGVAGLGELVLPVECAGCGEPGVALCRDCRSALRSRPREHRQGAAALGCPVWFGSDYSGVVAQVLREWKERGRADLADPLSQTLSELLAGVLDGEAGTFGPVTVLVPVPSRASARRARGRDVLGEVVRKAAHRYRRAGGSPVRVGPVLTLGRRVRDQSALTAAQRHHNLSGAMRVPPGRARVVARRPCLIIDDILTTAATVSEAKRALSDMGAEVVGVLTLCATPRRSQMTHTSWCSHRCVDWSSVGSNERRSRYLGEE